MCGIFASLCDKPNGHILWQYFEKIRYRGPDSSDFQQIDFIYGMPLYFGFHRLAVVDLSDEAIQPFHYNGIYLICNGEIYNHIALENKYGIKTQTKSDCEIILYLFEYFGRNEYALNKILEELDGEFSFILYDRMSACLMAARDPYGVRPLFYSYAGDEVCFASELKALTFRKTVKPFKPGTYFYKTPQETRIITYYTYPNAGSINSLCKQNIYANIRDILARSVRMRLMSDRPLGCFLSGGIDSSLITALTAKEVKSLNCFTIGLKNGADIHAARKVVNFINRAEKKIKHHEINFTIEDGIKACPAVIYQLETYDITTIRASIPQFLLARYIAYSTNIRVLLCGEGSDEVNASYLYYHFTPSPHELAKDSERLIRDLYMFDNLRVDRTTAAFGLEVRLPFLGREYVEYMLSLDPKLRMPESGIEKKILRDAFAHEDILPKEILYRRKEAFSDAVDSNEVSWYRSLRSYIDKFEFSSSSIIREPSSTNQAISKEAISKEAISKEAISKEAIYYKRIFDETYSGYDKVLSYYWMPRWIDTGADPSASVIKMNDI